MKLNHHLGVCQWFHYGDTAALREAAALLSSLNVRHVRTGGFWADCMRPDGWKWQQEIFDALRGFKVLPCLWCTPPSLACGGRTNGPPHNLEDYADFVWDFCDRFGAHFSHVELWNEPNNRIKWDTLHDPDLAQFGTMIAYAAHTAHTFCKKRVVLGGISPIDAGFFGCIPANAWEWIDTVAVHAFPGQWNEHAVSGWSGWDPVQEHVTSCLARLGQRKKLWITEVGAASSPDGTKCAARDPLDVLDELVRSARLTGVERAYWYSLRDLPHERDEIEYTVEGRREPLEHGMGLFTEKGEPKPVAIAFKDLLH